MDSFSIHENPAFPGIQPGGQAKEEKARCLARHVRHELVDGDAVEFQDGSRRFFPWLDGKGGLSID